MKKIFNNLLLLAIGMGLASFLAINANAACYPVNQGGLGACSLTPYAVIVGGQTQTAQVQQPAVGVSGQVLTSNGAGAIPTFQTPQSGSGSVTTFSVSSAHGFSGTVSNPTTTPQATLSTTVTGIIKGSGGSLVSATGDTDYQNPISITTIGSSGAATFSGDVLNIPQYSSGGGGSGTVTTVSVASANGFTGTVANATTTPAITVATSITGLLKGNGTAISAATAGTDYLAPSGSGSALTGIPTSVSNSDGTLTISPTTGSVVGSLNLGHANTWTAGQTISTAPFTISGNQSQSAWTTNGTQLSIAAATLTDTSSSGTVASMGINSFGQSTVAASNATTYTNAATVWITGNPIASTNVTFTNGEALYVAAGRAVFNGGLSTASAFGSSNFTGIAGNGIQAATTTSSLLFGGATTLQMRALFNGNNSTTLTTGNSYANVIVGSSPVTGFTSGTSAWAANLVVNPIGTITPNGSTFTNSASLYIGGADTGATNNYSIAAAGTIGLYNNIKTAGIGVPAVYGSGINVSLNTTSTAVASYTPTSASGQQFVIDWTLGCKTSSTPTLQVTFTDPNAGSQTITLYGTAMTSNTVQQGSYTLDATSGAAISVTGSDATALGDIYGTASIKQEQ